jgi:hypothetical protein
MTASFTAFEGPSHLATGTLVEVAMAVKRANKRHPSDAVLIFDDGTGRAIDLDLRGSDADILARLPQPVTASEPPAPSDPSAPRGRGRPKLGVVAREVTLLPRHWDWLGRQPGGASVALRKLVEAARRANSERDRSRLARDAAYHFMSAMAGNLPGFEEAARALFAGDRPRFTALTATWSPDIRDHILKLASNAFTVPIESES